MSTFADEIQAVIILLYSRSAKVLAPSLHILETSKVKGFTHTEADKDAVQVSRIAFFLFISYQWLIRRQ